LRSAPNWLRQNGDNFLFSLNFALRNCVDAQTSSPSPPATTTGGEAGPEQCG
jgi:hypothetical protein